MHVTLAICKKIIKYVGIKFDYIYLFLKINHMEVVVFHEDNYIISKYRDVYLCHTV